MSRHDLSGYEWKPAEKVVIGDYLPFIVDGESWPLEVVKADVKARRVWISVIVPGREDEPVQIRPRRSERLAYKEAATMIEEAEARLREGS